MESQTRGESLTPKLSCPIMLGMFVVTQKEFMKLNHH